MNFSSTQSKMICVLFVYLSACNLIRSNAGLHLTGTHLFVYRNKRGKMNSCYDFFAVVPNMLPSVWLLPAKFLCMCLLIIAFDNLIHSDVTALKTKNTTLQSYTEKDHIQQI